MLRLPSESCEMHLQRPEVRPLMTVYTSSQVARLERRQQMPAGLC